MSREVLFRAWDEEDQKFVYSNSEDDFVVFGFSKGKLKCTIYKETGPAPDIGLEEPITGLREVVIDEVEQYIGQEDVDGVEIYFGDILSVIDPDGEKCPNLLVKWDKDLGTAAVPVESVYAYITSSIGRAVQIGYEFKIIGHIHANPELFGGNMTAIHKQALKIGSKIPEEDLEKLPTDLAQNYKHYLYGGGKMTATIEEIFEKRKDSCPKIYSIKGKLFDINHICEINRLTCGVNFQSKIPCPFKAGLAVGLAEAGIEAGATEREAKRAKK